MYRDAVNSHPDVVARPQPFHLIMKFCGHSCLRISQGHVARSYEERDEGKYQEHFLLLVTG
jgi:hypothetical protein